MLFEPALKRDIPDGLDLFPALVNVPPGASKTVKIPVCNSTKHDIFLPPRTALGCIEGIIDSRPIDFGPPYQQSGQSSTDTYIRTTQGSQVSHNSIPENYTSKKNGILLLTWSILISSSRKLCVRCSLRNLMCLLERRET